MNSTEKIVLITGGSRGLGKNMALKVAAKGLDVILTYNSNQKAAESVVDEIESMGRKAAVLQLDTSKISDFADFEKRLKEVLRSNFGKDRIDFLVNNAGVGIHTEMGQTTEEQFDQLMNIHVKGVVFLTQRMLAMMNDDGGIINVSSGLARFAMPGYSVYGSLKAAMDMYTRYEAKELGVRGIRANIIAPGAIETDFGGGAVRDNKELNNYLAAMIPLGRVGVPDDIGGVVAFLCTEDARWINGQRIEASGGQGL